jgi:hypothetical protein
MKIEITQIMLVTKRGGPDVLVLSFAFPCGCWPYEAAASAQMQCAAGGGAKYAAEHFPGVPLTLSQPDPMLRA